MSKRVNDCIFVFLPNKIFFQTGTRLGPQILEDEITSEEEPTVGGVASQ